MFLIAKDRLLDINHWQEIADGPGARFTITDAAGHTLNRKVHQGDYIQIDLPAPGTNAGDGYDWVHAESIVYDDYPDENSESIKLQLRPAQAPGNDSHDTAHFFSPASTSTFIIERHGKLLVAYYYGRNEVPNNDTGNTLDNARNTLVALGALAGLSDVQWNNLIKGFLAFDD